jgi:hypothetical protein
MTRTDDLPHWRRKDALHPEGWLEPDLSVIDDVENSPLPPGS